MMQVEKFLLPSKKISGGSGAQRIGYIDSLKGFASLCVVVGHVVNGNLSAGVFPDIEVTMRYLLDIIYSFHMALYMMISGFLFQIAYIDKDGKIKIFRINRQMVNLTIIYISFSVMFGLFQHMLSAFSNSQRNLIDVFLIWCRPISPYWYLYDLVFFYWVFVKVDIGRKNEKTVSIVLAFTTLLGMFVQIELFEIISIMLYGLLFYINMMCAKHQDTILHIKSSLCV